MADSTDIPGLPTPSDLILRPWRFVCGSGAAYIWHSSRRTGAPGETIGSTRGLRVDRSVGVSDSGTARMLTGGGFEVNKASAAWRALVICSRSSPRGFIAVG
jgi:hypothetical protein